MEGRGGVPSNVFCGSMPMIMLTVVKCVHQAVGVLQNTEPDKHLRHAIVGKCSNDVDVAEGTETNSTTARPDISDKDLRSLVQRH